MKLFLNGGGCGKQTLPTYEEINKIINHNNYHMDDLLHP